MCSAHKERGSCTNGNKLSATRVEDAVLSGIKTCMLQPKLIEEFMKTFNQKLTKVSRAANVKTNATDEKQVKLDKQLNLLLNAIQLGGPLPSLIQRLHGLEQRKAALMQQTATAPNPRRIELPVPELAETYRQKVDNLRSSLTADQLTQIKAAASLSSNISRIELHPADGKDAAKLKITVDMAAVVGLGRKYENTAIMVVARARYHRPPRPDEPLFSLQLTGV